jgi:hypothetical protein
MTTTLNLVRLSDIKDLDDIATAAETPISANISKLMAQEAIAIGDIANIALIRSEDDSVCKRAGSVRALNMAASSCPRHRSARPGAVYMRRSAEPTGHPLLSLTGQLRCR